MPQRSWYSAQQHLWTGNSEVKVGHNFQLTELGSCGTCRYRLTNKWCQTRQTRLDKTSGQKGCSDRCGSPQQQEKLGNYQGLRAQFKVVGREDNNDPCGHGSTCDFQVVEWLQQSRGKSEISVLSTVLGTANSRVEDPHLKGRETTQGERVFTFMFVQIVRIWEKHAVFLLVLLQGIVHILVQQFFICSCSSV